MKKVSKWIIGLVGWILLTGCQNSLELVEAPLVGHALPTPTITQPSLTIPTITKTPQLFLPSTSTPSPTPVTCQKTNGQVDRLEGDTGAVSDSGQPPLTYRIYTPPCYGEFPEAVYPVLYILHGQSFGDDQWDNLGMDEAADTLISSGELPPFLIVMPLEENTWLDTYGNPYGDLVAEDLVRWVDQNYQTCTDRLCRAIGGLSRGGGWAVHIGFTRWQLFSSIGAHSTPVFVGDPDRLPTWLQDIPREQIPRVYMDIGHRDQFAVIALEFENVLTSLRVPHEYYLFQGAHNEEYWSSHIEDYLRWYASPWKSMFEPVLNNSQ